MKTTLHSNSGEVHIHTGGPIVIIGEKINPAGNEKLARELQAGRFDYLGELAQAQIAAGADVLDVNVCVPGMDEVALLTEAVKYLSARVTVPLSIDSSNPRAIASALSVVPGKPLVNSVNGREEVLKEMLPRIKDRGAGVIALTLDEKGIPEDSSGRIAIAERILYQAAKSGISAEDVLIDPLVLAVSTDQNAGETALDTIELLRTELGVHVVIGASNVSFGLPGRDILNCAFLAMAAGAGVNCVITDPLKYTGFIRAADLLCGRDPYSKRYIRNWRGQRRGLNNNNKTLASRPLETRNLAVER
jgi:5-methyltetrahydrofolate--homocysteine methyltransferase